jgi:hypothetical protein
MNSFDATMLKLVRSKIALCPDLRQRRKSTLEGVSGTTVENGARKSAGVTQSLASYQG